MALQSTGKISLSDIQTMFGGTNPIGMSEYYNNNASGFTTGVTGIPNSGATISISHFYGKAKPSSGSLYTFSSHTFTNAGATGKTGPIISQVRSAYSGATWAQNNSYLSMTTQGIQLWTVPATGSYTITCAGAGGNKGYGTAGRGYVIVTNQTLNKGQVLKILVGQVGTSAYGRGGGGGTFVATSLNIPLVVCGGGGGVNLYDNQVGKDATGIGGADVAGSDGAGTSGCGMHGAGGASFTNNSTYALSFVNGGTGGSMPAGGCVTISYGGFGGGGGGGNGGGGGGGYSGGNGGENNPPYYGGYGGGSYCSTTVNSTSYNPHNTEGYVTITQGLSIASIANLVLWHNGYNIDGSNNSTLSSGIAISSWYNSGTDASLTTTQSTSSSRPTYTLNGAVFSSGKSLISNINLNSSTYTAMNIFIVWKKTQSSSTLKWLWSQDDGGYDRTLIINSDSSLMVGTGNGGANFPNYSFPINSVVVVNCEYNSSGQTGYFFVNNTSLETFSNSTASGTATTQFGSNGGGASSIDGVIHEVLIISRVLTTTERTNIYNALLAKY